MQLPEGKVFDCSLQLGDMGLFNKKAFDAIKVRDNHKMFRGNHDNPEIFNDHPNSIGDFGFHQDMFWCGGGYSIDHHDRIQGVEWWPDEELSYGQFDKAIQLYAETKPRVVVTHECPSVAKSHVLAEKTGYVGGREYNSRTEQALQCMFEIHMPGIWVFGHYHARMDKMIEGTRFVCLNDNRGPIKEMFFEIPNLDWK